MKAVKPAAHTPLVPGAARQAQNGAETPAALARLIPRPHHTRVISLLALLALPLSAHAGHELDNRDITAGLILYADHCASCHGANLEGQPDWQVQNPDGTMPAPPHDQTGHTWHHDNALLFSYTKLGGEGALAQRGVTNFKSGMPGFGDVMTDDEIWNVLAFIRSTWPRRVQEIQTARNPPHQ